MRKRLMAQIRAHQKLGTAEMFDDIDSELKARHDTRIKELEERISATISRDDAFREIAAIIRTIPGIGPVASTILIAEMPELGAISAWDALPRLMSGNARTGRTLLSFFTLEKLIIEGKILRDGLDVPLKGSNMSSSLLKGIFLER